MQFFLAKFVISILYLEYLSFRDEISKIDLVFCNISTTSRSL